MKKIDRISELVRCYRLENRVGENATEISCFRWIESTEMAAGKIGGKNLHFFGSEAGLRSSLRF